MSLSPVASQFTNASPQSPATSSPPAIEFLSGHLSRRAGVVLATCPQLTFGVAEQPLARN
jgi:hypothetical protein